MHDSASVGKAFLLSQLQRPEPLRPATGFSRPDPHRSSQIEREKELQPLSGSSCQAGPDGLLVIDHRRTPDSLLPTLPSEYTPYQSSNFAVGR